MRRYVWKLSALFGASALRRAASRHGRRLLPEIASLEQLESRSLPTAGNASALLNGTAFIDANGDGEQASPELLAPGVVVHLEGTTNQGIAVHTHVTTDSEGAYNFENILPGTYELSAGGSPRFVGSPRVISGIIVDENDHNSLDQTFDVALTSISPRFLSLRNYVTTPLATGVPPFANAFEAAGDGETVPVNDRENNRPVATNPIDEILVHNNSTTNLVDVFSDIDSELPSSNESLTYSVVSVVNAASNPGLVTASISGNQLTVNYLPDQIGSATVTLKATDHFGAVSDNMSFVTATDHVPFVANSIDAITVDKNSDDTTIDLAGVFSDDDITHSLVTIKTSSGDVHVELFDNEAPQTVANFFNYVTSNLYDNTIIHRSLSNFVIQGGGFSFDSATHTLPHIDTDNNSATPLPTVENEFDGVNRSNLIGTIAMAKVGGDPNSATSEFFFNLGNNSANLDNQNGGFTVFAKIVGAADQTVLDTIEAIPTRTIGGLSDVPLVNYPTGTISDATAANFVKINDVTVDRRRESLTYTVVSNTNTSLVAASIVNNRLTLNYTPDLVGTALITIRATDSHGATFETTFPVTVANQLPVATVALSPSSPTVTDTLTATATRSDADGDPVTLSYVWKVNGLEVQHTDDTSALTNLLDLTTVADVQVNDVITVEVIPNDGTNDGVLVSATKTIA